MSVTFTSFGLTANTLSADEELAAVVKFNYENRLQGNFNLKRGTGAIIKAPAACYWQGLESILVPTDTWH